MSRCRAGRMQVTPRALQASENCRVTVGDEGVIDLVSGKEKMWRTGLGWTGA